MIKKHHKLVNAWFNKAEKDLTTVEHEFFFDDPVYETICFHCQQAVEKFLKGYLIYLEIGYQKTHEIGELVSICERKDRGITHLKEDADKLTDYAVEIRYPDDYYIPKKDEAISAYKIAKDIKKLVLKKIKL